MSRAGRRDRIELTDQGLEEHLALGRVRHTPWSQVRRVVWTGPGRAEVHCADGHTVVLTGEPERLDEQMAAIRQTAAAVQARWRTHGVPAAVVSSWLGMQPGGE